MLSSLGAEQGDQVRLRPTRKGAAEARLVPAEELRTSLSSQQPEAASDSGSESGGAGTVAAPAAAAEADALAAPEELEGGGALLLAFAAALALLEAQGEIVHLEWAAG